MREQLWLRQPHCSATALSVAHFEETQNPCPTFKWKSIIASSFQLVLKRCPSIMNCTRWRAAEGGAQCALVEQAGLRIAGDRTQHSVGARATAHRHRRSTPQQQQQQQQHRRNAAAVGTAEKHLVLLLIIGRVVGILQLHTKEPALCGTAQGEAGGQAMPVSGRGGHWAQPHGTGIHTSRGRFRLAPGRRPNQPAPGPTPAGRRRKLARQAHVQRLAAKQEAQGKLHTRMHRRTAVVRWRVHPQHRLPQAMPLARGAAVLEGGVHHVRLHLLVLKQALRVGRWEGRIARGRGGIVLGHRAGASKPHTHTHTQAGWGTSAG